MVKRRVFSPEFKGEAVKLVKDRGVTLAQAARDLGIHYNVLTKWVNDAKPATSGSGLTTATEHKELVKLRRENAQLKMERDILKKAAAYFAKDHL